LGRDRAARVVVRNYQRLGVERQPAGIETDHRVLRREMKRQAEVVAFGAQPADAVHVGQWYRLRHADLLARRTQCQRPEPVRIEPDEQGAAWPDGEGVA